MYQSPSFFFAGEDCGKLLLQVKTLYVLVYVNA